MMHVLFLGLMIVSVLSRGEVDFCDVRESGRRFDCTPQGQASQAECQSRGCCWKPASELEAGSASTITSPPVCYFPLNYTTYTVTATQREPGRDQINATLERKSPYPRDIYNLKIDFVYLTRSTLRIRILDADNARWEPSLPVQHKKSSSSSSSLHAEYDYKVKTANKNQPLGFSVLRSSGEIVLETAGGFIYSDQFLQLSSFLPSHLLYGLGEHQQKLLVSTNWTIVTMWNHDHVPQEDVNLYGSHPFYICRDKLGWHGVFLHNSNAMDIILQPAPAITWRTIGGILDFFIFTGPTLHSVVSQYTDIVGRTFMPPYWALGFHLCWQSYKTANNTLETMNRLRKYGIPQDVQWNDIDYAEDARVYTTDIKNFGDQAGLAKEIHSRGMHYVIMVDCGISITAKPGTYEPYDLGSNMSIFINASDGKPLVGVVWPGKTVWPDFLNPRSQIYWTKIAKDFHDKVAFDGMWNDMNEISNFVDGSINGCDPHSDLDEPPYLPAVNGGDLYKHTICPSARHQTSSHYNTHNLYGLFETFSSYNTLREIRRKRAFVISRSTFSGQGQFGGHWSGDNTASFYDMYKSISALLQMNMFGIPVSGSDICGFHLNTTTELCTRWHQLGAFYVFARNHNSEDCLAQDPGQFGQKSAASTSKILQTRYSLLPYLYTLLYRSHVFGGTVATALVFEYPDDPQTQDLDSQFLWGPALMISPVLQENATSVTAYFPKDDWYNFYNGKKLGNVSGYAKLEAPIDVINLHVRGGYILPMQAPNLTTTLSRKNPFWLMVALDARQEAEGEMYLDDGDSLDTFEQGLYTLIGFSATSDGMVSAVQHLGYVDPWMVLTNVTVFGLARQPSSVTVNGVSQTFSFEDSVLRIPRANISLVHVFKIVWI